MDTQSRYSHIKFIKELSIRLEELYKLMYVSKDRVVNIGEADAKLEPRIWEIAVIQQIKEHKNRLEELVESFFKDKTL